MKTRTKVDKMIKASKTYGKNEIRNHNDQTDTQMCSGKDLTVEVDALKVIKDVDVLSKPKTGKVILSNFEVNKKQAKLPNVCKKALNKQYYIENKDKLKRTRNVKKTNFDIKKSVKDATYTPTVKVDSFIYSALSYMFGK